MMTTIKNATILIGLLASLGGCASILGLDDYERAECDPRKGSEPVSDICGVFVSSSKGLDTNNGTRAAPVKTIERAVLLLSGTPLYEGGARAPIFLCAESFTGQAELPAGVTLHGGLDCHAQGENAWSYQPPAPDPKTILTAEMGELPLRLLPGAMPTTIKDVRVIAASAADAAAGTSSISVIAKDAEATFDRCALEAGDGAPGEAGALHPSDGEDGMEGIMGEIACDPASSFETSSHQKQCATGGISTGGIGGSGGVTAGNPGSKGDYENPNAPDNGGQGEAAVSCTPGDPGAEGSPGTPGADAIGLGDLDEDAGHTGLIGNPGNPGTPGGAGGGGGGAKSRVMNVNQCPGMTGSGASGGSGGTGGCGGAGGLGGGYGGSSIAVVSLASKLTFTATRISVGSGGKPGAGGEGQPGGNGGMGASGGANGGVALLKGACAGGPGGNGGSGGKGGNGTGGHAIGVAYTISAPMIELNTGSSVKLGGSGGDMNALNVSEQEFPL